MVVIQKVEFDTMQFELSAASRIGWLVMLQAGTRVLVTCATFEPGYRGGGPVRSVAQIIDSAPADLDILLVTRDRDLGSDEPYPGLSGRWISRGRAKVFYLNTRSIRQLSLIHISEPTRPY